MNIILLILTAIAVAVFVVILIVIVAVVYIATLDANKSDDNWLYGDYPYDDEM